MYAGQVQVAFDFAGSRTPSAARSTDCGSNKVISDCDWIFNLSGNDTNWFSNTDPSDFEGFEVLRQRGQLFPSNNRHPPTTPTGSPKFIRQYEWFNWLLRQLVVVLRL